MTTRANEPTLDLETEILKSGVLHLACIDEVGRGALAGPVVLGVVVLSLPLNPQPRRVRDSKLLSPQVRQQLIPDIQQWARAVGVGRASAEEIDAFGIMKAMGLAGQRALQGLSARIDAVLLDGNFNYLRDFTHVKVMTKTKADLTCAGVAAASIIAKCDRDAHMEQLDRLYPGYGFSSNKGYASPAHVLALTELGVSPVHRSSWSLPGIST